MDRDAEQLLEVADFLQGREFQTKEAAQVVSEAMLMIRVEAQRFLDRRAAEVLAGAMRRLSLAPAVSVASDSLMEIVRECIAQLERSVKPGAP